MYAPAKQSLLARYARPARPSGSCGRLRRPRDIILYNRRVCKNNEKLNGLCSGQLRRAFGCALFSSRIRTGELRNVLCINPHLTAQLMPVSFSVDFRETSVEDITGPLVWDDAEAAACLATGAAVRAIFELFRSSIATEPSHRYYRIYLRTEQKLRLS